MITQIRGMLRFVGEDELTLAVEPLEIAVLIPEYTRRQLQQRVVGLHREAAAPHREDHAVLAAHDRACAHAATGSGARRPAR